MLVGAAQVVCRYRTGFSRLYLAYLSHFVRGDVGCCAPHTKLLILLQALRVMRLAGVLVMLSRHPQLLQASYSLPLLWIQFVVIVPCVLLRESPPSCWPTLRERCAMKSMLVLVTLSRLCCCSIIWHFSTSNCLAWSIALLQGKNCLYICSISDSSWSHMPKTSLSRILSSLLSKFAFSESSYSLRMCV